MASKRIIEQTFLVPFKHVQFHYGGVSCKKLLKNINKTISITIVNYDIREEFDAVKDYFANAIGSNKIEVAVRVEMEGDAVKTVEAKSPQIADINGELIHTVRFQFIKDVVKKKVKIDAEKTLLNMDEFIEAASDKKISASSFYQDEKELAEDLLLVTETKHYHHLRYLSGKHAHDVMRLRFILQPFSFLFLLQGEEKYHIVWETLDTEEATYLWPVDKDLSQLKLRLKQIEEIIQLVKVQGKAAYLSSAAEGYKRIFHHYKDGVKGFIKWKGELETCLV